MLPIGNLHGSWGFLDPIFIISSWMINPMENLHYFFMSPIENLLHVSYTNSSHIRQHQTKLKNEPKEKKPTSTSKIAEMSRAPRKSSMGLTISAASPAEVGSLFFFFFPLWRPISKYLRQKASMERIWGPAFGAMQSPPRTWGVAIWWQSTRVVKQPDEVGGRAKYNFSRQSPSKES